MWWPMPPPTRRSRGPGPSTLWTTIIFRRAGEPPLPPKERLGITGRVLQLQLPPHLEDISSTRIRENVDLNRDISNLIDPVIQDFIYQNGLYLRDSQNQAAAGRGDPLLPVGWTSRRSSWWMS